MSAAGEDAEEMPMGVPAAAAKPWTRSNEALLLDDKQKCLFNALCSVDYAVDSP
jgi:hypothetical protein